MNIIIHIKQKIKLVKIKVQKLKFNPLKVFQVIICIHLLKHYINNQLLLHIMLHQNFNNINQE